RVANSIAVVLALAHLALAKPSSEADEAFKRGRDLAKTGDYAGACKAFERSQELDPQLGTLFNIGQCDEKIGKQATALAAYREVIAKDTNEERRKFAADLASKLAARVPKLVVQ